VTGRFRAHRGRPASHLLRLPAFPEPVLAARMQAYKTVQMGALPHYAFTGICSSVQPFE
jgi:hypothetical protein